MYQNLCANFCAPKSGNRFQKGPVISPLLFRSFEFENRSRMSDEKLVILKFEYLQNKKWWKQSVKNIRIKKDHRAC